MTTIHCGRGSIVVDNPPAPLLEGLRRFNGSTGEYESLYSLSFDGKVMITMPGFAERIRALCPNASFGRTGRLPKPDVEAAVYGLDYNWRQFVRKAVSSNGGIVCLPDVLGEIDMTAAILRAFPQRRLFDIGCPMSVVAVPDDEMVQTMVMKLQDLLPGRDIGLISSRRCRSTDDIMVMTYTNVKEMARQPVGILVGCDLSGTDVTSYVGSLSSIKDAARFGLYATPLGDTLEPDIVQEGLFGKVVAQCTYPQMVDAGVAVPVTVCWLPAPKPQEIGPGPFEMVEAMAMQENTDFVSLVADIAKAVPSDIGVIVATRHNALAQRVAIAGNLVQCWRKMRKAQLRAIRDDLINGVIRRVVATDDLPLKTSLGVVILASCEGYGVVGKRIPWRRNTGAKDKAYIVDFRHIWDMHNGRPGYLARNDEARARRYTELGFRQMALDSVNQLPFIGG